MFGLHCTSLFSSAQPYLHYALCTIAIIIGIINHYIYPQLRRQTPWKLFSRPLLRAHEFGQFETTVEARLTRFEITHLISLSIERNVIYPLLIVGCITYFGEQLSNSSIITLALPFVGLRLLRGAFCQPQLLYLPLVTALLLTSVDLRQFQFDSYFPFIFYILVVIWPKMVELMLKMEFVIAYIAPWQISWGSAFHAFAQPFSVPHSAFIWIQAIISSIISAPLNPFLGNFKLNVIVIKNI
jgi:hypothetical protein